MVIRRMIGYGAALLLILYLYFMYNDRVLSGILLFFIIYPVLALGYLAAVRRKVTAAPERVPPVGEQDRRIRGGIVIRNGSRIWNARYRVCISLGSRFSRRRKRAWVSGQVSPGGEETGWCEFETGLCGNMVIRTEALWIFDLTGIFCLRKKLGAEQTVKVMPGFRLMPLEITRKTREFQADAEEYSGEKKGDDPSEIYQVREYRTRDSLRDVHWKLSAKEDSLMVKERGFPLGCVVLIWIDLPQKECSEDGFSRMLEKAASLSVTLAEEKCVHMAAWYDEEGVRVVKKRVRDEESACEMIWSLMDARPYRDRERMQVCYDQTFRGQEFAGVVTIDGRGRIRKDGEAVEYLQL